MIAMLSLLVDDYDNAIAFYRDVLGFQVMEDTHIDDSKRWVVVAPKTGGGCRLLLAKAVNENQKSRIGNQTGGRVFLFLHTDHFWRDYDLLRDKNVEFVRPPSTEPYGTVAVFKDLYGNLWDLIEPTEDRKVRT